MKYIVHRIEVDKNNVQEKLEEFLNTLNGEVISVIPDVRQTFRLLGATSKVDSILIIEKKGVVKIRGRSPNYEDLQI